MSVSESEEAYTFEQRFPPVTETNESSAEEEEEGDDDEAKEQKTTTTTTHTAQTSAKGSDVLVLDGANTRTLVYHIGLVSRLIMLGFLRNLKHTFGSSYSAILAWHIAKIWPVIDYVRRNSKPMELNSQIIKLVSDPLKEMLLDKNIEQWPDHVASISAFHETLRETYKHQIADSPDVTFTCAAVRLPTFSVDVILAPHELDCVFEAARLGLAPAQAAHVMYNSVFVAMKSLSVALGTEPRYVLSTRACTKTPSKHQPNVVLFPMNADVASSSSATYYVHEADAKSLGRLRKQGSDECCVAHKAYLEAHRPISLTTAAVLPPVTLPLHTPRHNIPPKSVPKKKLFACACVGKKKMPV